MKIKALAITILGIYGCSVPFVSQHIPIQQGTWSKQPQGLNLNALPNYHVVTFSSYNALVTFKQENNRILLTATATPTLGIGSGPGQAYNLYVPGDFSKDVEIVDSYNQKVIATVQSDANIGDFITQ